MSYIVTLPYDPVWQAVEWAKEHCPSYITNQINHSNKLKQVPGGFINDHKIDYYFSDERDAFWFSLRWS